MTATAHTFTGVCVHRKNHVYISAISDELADRNEDHTLVYRWIDGDWAHRPLTFSVGSVCQTNIPKPTVLCVGINGQVDLFTNPGSPGQAEEHVDSSFNGPSDLLHLKCSRSIGEHVYVAGMARRVYHRNKAGIWTAIDKNVFVPRTQRERGIGFNSIDGVSEDKIIAVGYGGEIWRFDGNLWQQEESPTNIVLTCVRCLDKNTYFAAGLAGVVLRARGGNWEVIDHDATIDDFWGMTVFNNRVYLSAYEGIFVIDGDGVVPINMNLKEKLSTAYLDANDGVMWSVGQKDMAYTNDCLTWQEVPSAD